MKLPGSQQGFSSHPIVTQMVEAVTSLPTPCSAACSLYAESLWCCSSTDQWCKGRKGQALEWCWLCSHPAHQSSDLHSEPDPIPAPAGFTGKTLWGFQEALAQQPIPGELQAETDVSSKQCCHVCCKDD